MNISAPVFWLLDIVIESKLAVDILVADNIEEYLNQAPHALSRTELTTTLSTLFEKQWISAWVFKDGHASPLLPPYTAQNIEQYLTQDSQSPGSFHRPLVYYGLTPAGGQQWEQVTNPDWMSFVQTLYGVNPEEGSIASATRQVVEQWFDNQIFEGYEVLPDSIQWENMHPWQATYWKQLPEGYRVTFLYHYHALSAEQDSQKDERLQKEVHWYTPPFLTH